MTTRPEDRPVLLVTGGSRGIGAAVARLAAPSHRVAIAYAERQESAADVVAEVEDLGGEAIAVRTDVASEESVAHLFQTVDHRFGRLDVLVQSAGILAPLSRLDAISGERIARILEVNVLGAFLCSREAVHRMSTRHGGSGGAIVNVSSRAAQLGSPGEFIDYAASKAAIDTLTIGLAKEVATEGVRVNAVRPGLIHTTMHASTGDPGRVDRLRTTVPMQRGGTADEVAQSILWLASNEASYCTGSILDVAGGR